MSDSSTDLLLRVNGIQVAFGIEFGFASQRADEGRAHRAAHPTRPTPQIQAGIMGLGGE